MFKHIKKIIINHCPARNRGPEIMFYKTTMLESDPAFDRGYVEIRPES